MAVSSLAISRFVERLAREDVGLHAFELRQDGAVRAEGYAEPFRKGEMHRMYSVSKSMVSLAVGLLAEEGRLELDAPVTQYFPEWPAAEPRLQRLTIRQMLCMATCYSRTTYVEGQDESWAKTFFCGKPDHEPGTVFCYDTSCSQVLGLLCQKLSGQPLLDFLTERVFAPIGAADPKKWLADPSGVAQGGTGLCMSLRDLGKVAQLVLDGGRGILPAWYLAEATRKQIDTPFQRSPEERYGYGWQFWRTRQGWTMYGMGGQLAVAVPEKRLLLCTLADTRLDPMGLQKLYDAFFAEIVEAPEEKGAPLAEPFPLRLPALPNDPSCACTGAWAMGENPLGVTRVEIAPYSVTLDWGAVSHRFVYEPEQVRRDVFRDTPCLVSAGWYAPGALRLRVSFIGDAPCGFELLLSQAAGRLTVQARCSGAPLTKGMEGFAASL